MNYEFPQNITIKEVRQVIARQNEKLGAPVFVEREYQWGRAFDYVITFAGSFPPIEGSEEEIRDAVVLRECRGLIFDNDGNILSRKFSKFFNLNERAETNIENIDWSQPYDVLEKLDGSVVSPLNINGTIAWGTKMGITDLTPQIESFVNDHSHYNEFATICIEAGYTPVFEWCSIQNKIVLEYQRDRLVLTAIRNNLTGQYLSYDDMSELAGKYGVNDIAKRLPYQNIHTLVSEIQEVEGIEGFVIRFDCGHMVKLKSPWYFRAHRSRSHIETEKDVFQMIVNNTLDDIKPHLTKDDALRVERYHSDFMKNLIEWIRDSQRIADIDPTANMVDFITMLNDLNLSDNQRVTAMALRNKKDGVAFVMTRLRFFSGSNPRIDKVREMIGNIRWKDYY